MVEEKWIKANSKTNKRDYYNMLFLPYILGEGDSNKSIFPVPIGSFKNQKWMVFMLMHQRLDKFKVTIMVRIVGYI